MDMLDIFVAFLCGEGKRAANGLEAGGENPACHLAHGLIRGDPGDPLAVSWDCGWFCFEKFLFGHGGFSLSFASGESSVFLMGRFLRPFPLRKH